jgi:hypothetical protein
MFLYVKPHNMVADVSIKTIVFSPILKCIPCRKSNLKHDINTACTLGKPTNKAFWRALHAKNLSVNVNQKETLLKVSGC